MTFALAEACPPPAHPSLRACRSRLATCIKLTKDLDGITVIVPDTNPDLSNYL